MDLQILLARAPQRELAGIGDGHREAVLLERAAERIGPAVGADPQHAQFLALVDAQPPRPPRARTTVREDRHRSEEHTSELQSLMRISYASFCLKQKNKPISLI